MVTAHALVLLAASLALGEGAAWAGLLAVGWSVRRASPVWRGQIKPGAALGRQGLALCVFIGSGVIAGLLGPYTAAPSHALGHWLPALAWPVVYVAARPVSAQARHRATAVFTAAVLVSVALGLLAYGPWLSFAESLVRLDTFRGEQNFVPGTRLVAASGLYFHRLKMAHVLLVALAPLTALCILGTRGRGQAWRAAVAAALCAAALALTFARAAYLGAASGVAMVWLAALWHRATPLHRLASLAAAAAGAAAALAWMRPDVLARALSAGSGEAAEVRAVIWSQAVTIATDHPWGVGLGRYPEVVARYYAAVDPMTLSPRTYPHSLVWMAWAEAGPLGAAALTYFWARGWLLGWAAVGRTQAPLAARQAGAAVLFMFTALGTVGLTHDVLFHNIVALTFFCALGLAQAEIDAAHPLGPNLLNAQVTAP